MICKIKNCEKPTKTAGLCRGHYRSRSESKKCSIDFCNVHVNANGYCSKHNWRYKKYGDPEYVVEKRIKRVSDTCSLDGCERPYSTMGYCGMHSKRYIRHGDPSKTIHKENEAHGMSYTKEYSAWRGIIDRCENSNNANYKHYGGRGISFHDEWRNSFKKFYDYIGPKPSDNYSIDRTDPNGNYEPGNVRWADKSWQSTNKRARGKSGLRGVFYDNSQKRRKRWKAILRINGNAINIGRYATKEEAHEAYKAELAKRRPDMI